MTDEVNLLLETFFRDASSNSIEAANEAVSEAVGILLYFDVYSKLVEHLLHSFAFMLRMSCKMSYVLLTIFSELVLKGFCKPQEMEEGEMEGESRSVDGMGLGDGDVNVAKDVSKEITSEDQLEEARKQGEEPKE